MVDAEELMEKYKQGISGITLQDIFVQALREHASTGDLENFCELCKRAKKILEHQQWVYVTRNIPALILNSYFTKTLSQQEYNKFTKRADYWEEMANCLREKIANEQWIQFSDLVKKIKDENKDK